MTMWDFIDKHFGVPLLILIAFALWLGAETLESIARHLWGRREK
jgi:hypothetical protein